MVVISELVSTAVADMTRQASNPMQQVKRKTGVGGLVMKLPGSAVGLVAMSKELGWKQRKVGISEQSMGSDKHFK